MCIRDSLICVDNLYSLAEWQEDVLLIELYLAARKADS